MSAFERLKSIETQYRIALRALAWLHTRSRRDPSEVATLGLRPRDVAVCLEAIEQTYVVRLFAEFEVTMIHVWRKFRPKQRRPRPIRRLMDRLASRCRVPTNVLIAAHEIRVYRNRLLHDAVAPPAVSIDRCRSALCRMISCFPRAAWTI